MTIDSDAHIKNGLAWINEQLRLISEKTQTPTSRETLANAGGFDSSIFPNITAGRQKPGVKFFNNVAKGFNALGAKHINAAIVATQFGLGGMTEELIEDDIARLIAHRLSKIKDSKKRRGLIKAIDNLIDIAQQSNSD